MIQRSRIALLTAVMVAITLVISACASTAPTPKPATPPPASVAATAEPTTAVASQPALASPTAEPTTEPTAEPTAEPTTEPTAEPTTEPTAEPTLAPTLPPTPEPTLPPTPEPTLAPTLPPTPEPTLPPTPEPTLAPTLPPTPEPTLAPTLPPTPEPTLPPTPEPTLPPTPEPTLPPTPEPTLPPTPEPTLAPTPEPTLPPTPEPTLAPTPEPTLAPTLTPTLAPPSVTPSVAPPSVAPSVAPATPVAEPDLLARIKEAGVIRVSVESNYTPYSFQTADGTWTGFNVDVAKEIAKRLGVEVRFEAPIFDLVAAGSWNDRWDMSVGSVTITAPRKDVLDFTTPYAFNPAQLAATVASGITTIDGFAGQKICTGGASTTYQQWLEGTLTLVDAPTPAAPPPGATAFPLETDQLCAQSVQSGRADFTGWLSSSEAIDAALKQGTPMIVVGDPVFYESLGIAFDNTVEDNDSSVAAVNTILDEMRADGTMLALSKQWFNGLDLVSGQ